MNSEQFEKSIRDFIKDPCKNGIRNKEDIEHINQLLELYLKLQQVLALKNASTSKDKNGSTCRKDKTNIPLAP